MSSQNGALVPLVRVDDFLKFKIILETNLDDSSQYNLHLFALIIFLQSWSNIISIDAGTWWAEFNYDMTFVILINKDVNVL